SSQIRMNVIDIVLVTQKGHGQHIGVDRGDFEQRKVSIAHGCGSQIGVGQVDSLFRFEPRTFRCGGKNPHMEFIRSSALDDASHLPVVKDHPLAYFCSLEGSWESAPDPRASGLPVAPGYGRI